MRDIGSNRITGPEAILTACVVWWFEKNPRVPEYVERALEERGDPGSFTSRVPLDLGESLAEAMPVDKLVQGFWDLSRHNPTVKHFVEQATKAHKADGAEAKIRKSRDFVRKLIVSELGRMVKESDWLEHNRDEVDAARRRRNRRRRNGSR